MADLSTNIPQISFGQADKETAVNELFDAASPSMLFGRNGVASGGLNFGIFGGRWNGVAVANKVLALTDNSTLYISANLSTGSATFQTGSFKTGEMPLYKVTTSGGLVTAYEDRRAAYGIGIPEAPTDGKQYARKDAGWAEVVGGGGGPAVMADITDKQGKVLDDPVIVSDGDIDSLMTPGGYLLDSNPANGFFAGSVVLVSAVDGYTLQQFLSPIFGVIQMRYHDGAAWQPPVTSVTGLSVQQWYSDTTADPPNAVINSNGTFSRSTFDVVATLAAKLDADQVGVAGGVASLDASGKVPAAQLPVTGGGVPEAPTDGKTYGRKDADWVEVISDGGGLDKLSVYLNTATNSHGSGAWGKVPIDAVSFDTNSIWDAVNKRAIPKKPGYYSVNIRVRINASGTLTAGVFKNGTLFRALGGDSSAAQYASVGATLIFCNGTTDYIEAASWSGSVTSYTTGGADTYMDIHGPL